MISLDFEKLRTEKGLKPDHSLGVVQWSCYWVSTACNTMCGSWGTRGDSGSSPSEGDAFRSRGGNHGGHGRMHDGFSDLRSKIFSCMPWSHFMQHTIF